MTETKKFYQSKTFWSAVGAATVAGVAAYFGETSTWTALAISVFSALGIYGRATATKKIVV